MYLLPEYSTACGQTAKTTYGYLVVHQAILVRIFISQLKIELMSDLWKFDGQYWTCFTGKNSDISSKYGTLGVPSPQNIIGGRILALVACYPNDIVWIFGGYGFDEKEVGLLSDIWIIDLKTNLSTPTAFTSGDYNSGNLKYTTSHRVSSDSESSGNSVLLSTLIPTLIVAFIIFSALTAGITYRFKRNRKVLPMQRVEEGNEVYGPIQLKEVFNRDLPIVIDERQPIEYKEIQIIKRLGGGFFGDVFQAKWRQAIVAVKKLHGTITQSSLKDFEEEALLMRRMNPHPNVVIFFGMCKDPLCIISEYVARGSLSSLLSSLTPMDNDLRLQILKGIASGMYHLTCEKIIHKVSFMRAIYN